MRVGGTSAIFGKKSYLSPQQFSKIRNSTSSPANANTNLPSTTLCCPSLHFLWLSCSKSSSGDLVLLRSHFLGIQNIGELSSAQFWYIYLGTSWIRSTADGGFAIESELNFAIQVAFEVRVQRAPWLLVFAIWTNEAIQQCIGCLFSDCHVPARREENDICTFALVLRGSTKRGPCKMRKKLNIVESTGEG